jgi:protein-tyrosine-phosphatase
MAATLARAWLNKSAPEHAERFRVSSAGLAASPDSPASEGAIEAAARQGLTLDGHRARMLTPEMTRGALVVTMTRAQADYVLRLAPGARVTTLAAWAGLGDGEDVRDPFMGSDVEYHACCEQIKRLIDKGFRRMLSVT